jgi:hypothetical protein
MLTYRIARNIPLQRLFVSPRINFEYPVRFHALPGRNGWHHGGGPVSGPGHLLPLPVVREQEQGWELLMGLARIPVDRVPMEGTVQEAAKGGLHRADGILHQALAVEGSDPGILEELIWARSRAGGFNWIERALALDRMAGLGMEERSDLLLLLDIPHEPERVRLFLRLARSAEEIRRPVAEGKLHPGTVFEIFRFPEEEQQDLARLISGLALGTRKRNQLLQMARDICTRDRIAASSLLLENPEARNIMSSPMDLTHRSARLFAWVEERRHPVMAGYRRRFFALAAETGLARYCRLEPPRDFETWEFTLRVTFTCPEELKKKLDGLGSIVDGEPFERLMVMRCDTGDGGEGSSGQ